MMRDTGSAEDKISISYTLTGLSHNDQVLLRSVLALYGTQGNAVWLYRQSREVDAIIIGSKIDPAEVSALIAKTRAGQIVLWISDAPVVSFEKYQVFQCKLRALQLAGRLKQIEMLVRQRQAASSAGQGDIPLETALVMLLQWPSAAFLAGDKDLLRMATMLSVRPMRLDDLAKNSLCSVEKCRDFLQRLHRAGFARLVVEEGDPASSSEQAEGVEKSRLKTLLGKIRASLGLSSA